VLFAAVVTGLDPFLQWSLAILAGGGAAAITQGGTVLTRAASTTTTAGLANFVVSTFETVASFFFSFLSIVVPVLAIVLLVALVASMYLLARRALRELGSRTDNPSA
jgi:hypothetical protein